MVGRTLLVTCYVSYDWIPANIPINHVYMYVTKMIRDIWLVEEQVYGDLGDHQSAWWEDGDDDDEEEKE